MLHSQVAMGPREASARAVWGSMLFKKCVYLYLIATEAGPFVLIAISYDQATCTVVYMAGEKITRSLSGLCPNQPCSAPSFKEVA